MGKGDKKTKRGKIIKGSYGKKRPKNKKVAIVTEKLKVKTKAAKKITEKEVKKPAVVVEPQEIPESVIPVELQSHAEPEIITETVPKEIETKTEAKKTVNPRKEVASAEDQKTEPKKAAPKTKKESTEKTEKKPAAKKAVKPKKGE